MQIGDHRLDPVDALAILQNYAVNYADTVRFYDLAGNPGGHPGPGSGTSPANAVTLGDIGRLVAINAALSAEDVAMLMDANAAASSRPFP